ncbi:efflux RND transporter permease subunit [Herbiconiux sp. SYSU D00978]|uniref:efflux RND transporter permease subunit n=1 Tax=Herbiconiux sp. SYSU D00978 TaxID=2812562 RepID=UPI001A96E9D9|nr:efflux RND transporter permease subunit [Herbiconiux sp. SYSU D00978]
MHLLSVFSLRNRALIALVTIVIGLFGGIALTNLRQELIPSVQFPQLVVVTAYPGAAPEVVNTDVSEPIETAIQSVAGLEETSSTSTTNLSTVSASFQYGTNITTVEQRVQLAINRIESQLPADVDPQVITGSIEDLPVIQIAVISDLDATELTSRLETSAIPDLQQLEGVRDAQLLGTTGQRVTITPDQTALLAAGFTTQSIRDALDANGVLIPAGSITEDDSTLTVQGGERIGDAETLAALPLVGDPGEVTTIGDVATVDVVEDPITGYSRVNGEPALTIAVTKTPEGNTVDVSHVVQDELPAIADAVGGDTEFTNVFDQAPYIEESIESLATEGLLGLVFAVIVILVFLLSIRSTLVTAISIPASVLITFIGLLAADYTLNILTLGALTIAIGRVVDDSIVVIENIKRHLSLGEEKLQAILTAVREVASAVTASTVTTVAVFLPLALVGDIVGELFRPFALTVTIALAASLFVSLTIVPVLAYWFLRAPRARKRAATDASGGATPARLTRSVAVPRPADLERRGPLQKGYLPVLRFSLKRPLLTLLAAGLVLVGTVALVPSLQTNFIGDSGQNTLTVTQELEPGTSLEAQNAAASEVEDILLDIEGIETVQTSVGSSEGDVQAAFFGSGDATFSVTTDETVDQVELQAEVRERLDELTDAGDIRVTASGSGFASSDIEVDVRAANQDDLGAGAEAVLAAVEDLDVTADATSSLAESQPFIAVTVDREAAAAAGLSEIAVSGIVAEAKLPNSIGDVVFDGDTLSVYITNPDAPQTLQELRDFPIPTATGLVPLSSLASVEEQQGPASISAQRGVRTATISVTPSIADVTSASAAIQEAVDEADLPEGVTAELGGVTTEQADAFGQLGIALLVAILIVYVVMVATFRSLRQPLLLLISVPFAATGAILLQVISGIPLGVPSLIGVLMLIGIVVTNAIVLVDLVNQYRERGLPAREAIVEGASRRLRPILMTALATIFALTPMALGITGQGGFISQPLAIVVIGGLVSSTALTLIVLPALYWLVEGAKERRAERRAVKAAAA